MAPHSTLIKSLRPNQPWRFGWVERGVSWGGAPRCGRAPREGGSAPATSVHVRVCPLVSAAPCRLLTQATGRAMVTSPLYPGPGDALLPDRGHPRGWPCWAQCRPCLDAVGGLECQAGRHMAAGQGSALPAPTQGPAVPPLPTPSPQGACLCPHHPHALPRPRQAPLCRPPRHAKAERCWSREGSWTAGERVSG